MMPDNKLIPVSYSRIAKYEQCPWAYKLRYIYGKKEPHVGNATFDALDMGNAFHLGIEEEDPQAAISYYLERHPNDEKAAINLRHAVTAALAEPVLTAATVKTYEYEINTPLFRGYVDCIAQLATGGKAEAATLIDFKLTNNAQRYIESPQLALYAYELERDGWRIDYCFWLIAPKIMPRKNESIEEYTARFENYKVRTTPALLDYKRTVNFWREAAEAVTATEFPKRPGNLCDWCGFKTDGICMPNEKEEE